MNPWVPRRLAKSIDGALALAACAVLLAVVWGVMAFKRPIYYEGYMGLTEVIKAPDVWNQIFMPVVMPTRIFLALPGVLLHYSRAPALFNQLLYGAVLAAEGAVIYLLCRRSLQPSRLVAFCGAAFALTSTTDFTFNDAAMSPLSISVLHFLIALLLLVAWVQDSSKLKLLLSCLFLNLSLWTYESALPGLLAGPAMVYFACTIGERRQRAVSGAVAWAFAATPFIAVYLHSLVYPRYYQSSDHYLRSGGLPAMSAAEHLQTAAQIFTIHLKPWLWGPGRPPLGLIPRLETVLPERTQLILALAGAAVFAIAALRLWLSERKLAAEAPAPEDWSVWRWVLGVVVLALLSSAMFARVQLSSSHYRTQLLSGMLFALIDAALLGALLSRRRAAAIAVLLASGVVFAGLRGGLERQGQMTTHARRQAAELRSIVERVPALRQKARLVLRIERGGFLATEARYLARSALAYLYQDASLEKRVFLSSPGRQLQCSLVAGQPVQVSCDDAERCGDKACAQSLFPLSSLVLFSYRPRSNSHLLQQRLTGADFPGASAVLLKAANESYRPEELIVAGPVNPIAREMLWFGAEPAGEPTLEVLAANLRVQAAEALPAPDERLSVNVDQLRFVEGQVCADGWAWLPGSGAALAGLEGVLSNGRQSYARDALIVKRPDVDQAMKGKPADYSGFHVCLPASAVPPGSYRFGLLVGDQGKRSFRLSAARLEIPAEQ